MSGQNRISRSTVALLASAAVVLGVIGGAVLVKRELAQSRNGGPPVVRVFDANRGGAPRYRYLEQADMVAVKDEFGKVRPVAAGENFVAVQSPLKSETLTIDLPGDGAVEYKATVRKGGSFVYEWRVENGLVYYDFHGHPAGDKSGFFTRYVEGEGSQQAGSIVAGYDGEHGWYWLNLGAAPVRVTLTLAGFYSDLSEFDMTSTQ